MIAVGQAHTLLVKPDGTVWTWGFNDNGQLGDGTTTDSLHPILISSLTDVRDIASSNALEAEHSLAVTGAGEVWTWGTNTRGQLGDGTTTAHHSPAAIASFSGVTSAKAGEEHSIALKSDGTVWSWGANGFGQLGHHGSTDQSTPGQVSNLTGITAIATWTTFNLALKSDGTVWGWGTDYQGELGDGGWNTTRPTPVQTSNLTSVVAIAAGGIHGLAVKSNGSVWAWGRNPNGQLGDGTTTGRTEPVQVSGLTNAIAVAGGLKHSLALKSDGTVWAWGLNSRGQLGDGTTTTRTTPVAVSGLSNIVSIAAGDDFSVAVGSDGIVYGWGANTKGQIGDWTTVDRWTPTPISDTGYAWKAGTPALSVAAGTFNAAQTVTVTNPQSGVDMHYTLSGAEPTQADPSVTGTISVDATATLKVAAWKSGFARSNTTSAAYTLTPVTPVLSPAGGSYTAAQTVTISTTTAQTTIRYTLDGSTPTESSTLYTAPVVVDTSGTLKAVAFRTDWTPSAAASGAFTMDFGTLPTPSVSPAAGTYISEAAVTATSIAGGTIRYTLDGTDPTTGSTLYTGPFSVLTTSTLKVKAWHPDYSPSATESVAYTIKVAAPVFSPSAGAYTAGQAIAVSTATSGATITYTLNGTNPTPADPGIASGGTLLAGNYTLKATAWKAGLTASDVTVGMYAINAPRVAGGAVHTLALRADGTLWAFGENAVGQIGDGTVTRQLTAVQVAGLTGVQTVAAGGTHSLALLGDGTVRAWGGSNVGQVGDGTTTTRTLPTAVGLSGVVAIAGGIQHSLALLSDGTVRAWGWNTFGQIGDNSQTQRNAPVAVTGLTGVTAIAGGSGHSLAVKSDGTVWAWGRNARGEIGDGTTTMRLVPTQVTGLTNVVAVAGGDLFSVALKSDGTVWSWGMNSSGQLGLNHQNDSLSPAMMTGVTGVQAIAVGYSHVLLLKSDGTLLAVGTNSEGQLGIPGGFLKVAAAVPGLSGVAAIGAGVAHSVAVMSDGVVRTWGRNDAGGLGDGTQMQRQTPTQVSGPAMLWKPPSPVIALAGGQYLGEQNAVVNHGDPSVVMHYTTTGADPTESDPVVAAGGGVAVTQGLTLRVRAYKTGAPPSEIAQAIYTLKAVSPTFSPGGGVYSATQSVSLSTVTSSSTIRYTLDGSTPTAFSTAYANPLTVAAPTTIKALVTRTGWTPSDVASATYWVAPSGTLFAPTISPAGGTYVTERIVTIAAVESGASVRYTIDGTDPTAQSPLYVRAFGIQQTLTVKARTFKAGYSPGPIASATFTIAPAGVSGAPTVSPVGGRFTTNRVVTVTGPASATLRYTTTGVDPTDTDTTITSGATLTVDRSMVLKVRAWETGLAPSVVRREDYLITGMIFAGEAHSIALKADGTVWTWGDNYWAQIGDGGSASRTTPFQALSGGVAVAAGFHHCLVAKADGTVWAWGHNLSGEVGDGTTTMRRSPVQVPGLTNVVAVAASFYNSYALKADGTVWAWGGNAAGQIGDGTTTTRLSPVQVTGLSGVRAIAAGENFALAIVGDGAPVGTLWSWGGNGSGELGNGTTTNSSTPQAVADAASVKSIATGRSFALARSADDELWLWGVNNNGQMGNGAQTGPSQLSPLRTGPWMGPLVEIGAGHSHVLALGRDGRLWGWGRSCEWQLAMGASCQWRLTVETMPEFTTAAAVSGGAAHSLAIARDGQVWAWGHNGHGQMGDGTLTWRATPVQVTGLQLANNAFLAGDQDGDGLSTWQEYQLGTDPLASDTDGDGVPDGVEAASGEAGTNLDPDGDGLSNALETALGTDPYSTDSDGDTVADGVDAFPTDATRSQAPAADPNDHTPPVIILIYPTNARPVGGGL
jgi:alpha-tubulin suppressor-like RCC1 family protein